MRNETKVIIDLAAVKANAALFSKRARTILPILKANAYGLGLDTMAAHFHSWGYGWIGLARMEEAEQVRQAGYTGRIFLIHCLKEEVSDCIRLQVEPAISCIDLIQALREKNSGPPLGCHLYINTGMNRFGLRPEHVLECAKAIEAAPNLKLLSVLTHPSSAEDPTKDPVTFKQKTLFDNSLQSLKEAGIHYLGSHIANTAFASRFPNAQLDIARIGIGLMGYTPSPSCQVPDLKPAVRLITHIVHILDCPSGEGIGYQGRYTVQKNSERIAVIPFGYADGFHVSYSQLSSVSSHGKAAPMVGRICMDYSMINITEIPEATLGSEVCIFGEGGLSLPEQAARFKTVPHELTSCLGPRVQRVYTGSSVDKEFTSFSSVGGVFQGRASHTSKN